MKINFLPVVFFVLSVVSACGAEVSEKTIMAKDNKLTMEGFFISAQSDCAAELDKIFRTHRIPIEQFRSPDKRWIAKTGAKLSQHMIELFDTEDKIKYILYHPNIEVGLLDISFDAESKYLSFVGSPWLVNGVSEIFLLNLETLELARFGELGRGYRHPQVLADGAALLFYESMQMPKTSSRTLRELANYENISLWVGFRNREGAVTYMAKYSGPGTEFIPLEDNFRALQPFLMPSGFVRKEKAGLFLALSSEAFKMSSDGKRRVSSYDEVEGTELLLSEGEMKAINKQNIKRREVLQKMRPKFELPDDIDSYSEENICLNMAQIQ
jgi:hypothetical protein